MLRVSSQLGGCGSQVEARGVMVLQVEGSAEAKAWRFEGTEHSWVLGLCVRGLRGLDEGWALVHEKGEPQVTGGS